MSLPPICVTIEDYVIVLLPLKVVTLYCHVSVLELCITMSCCLWVSLTASCASIPVGVCFMRGREREGGRERGREREGGVAALSVLSLK